MDKNVGRMFQVAAEGSAELASIQTNQLEANNVMASELQESLSQMRNKDVQSLVTVIQQIHGQLV